eukprot:NODE_577_length_2081_cov_29.481791_g532_i0.p1 GENE.NODE_577_length_2081_cov_29.481791_g532_i0~~NODE_577_length_2081_cov_29.481791_g532_i0.p1  ORF type:complete len:667 (+),score=115.24 NODE_577_length_2081_cov_29.481791_g532_i0:2-2002(+)
MGDILSVYFFSLSSVCSGSRPRFHLSWKLPTREGISRPMTDADSSLVPADAADARSVAIATLERRFAKLADRLGETTRRFSSKLQHETSIRSELVERVCDLQSKCKVNSIAIGEHDVHRDEILRRLRRLEDRMNTGSLDDADEQLETEIMSELPAKVRSLELWKNELRDYKPFERPPLTITPAAEEGPSLDSNTEVFQKLQNIEAMFEELRGQLASTQRDLLELRESAANKNLTFAVPHGEEDDEKQASRQVRPQRSALSSSPRVSSRTVRSSSPSASRSEVRSALRPSSQTLCFSKNRPGSRTVRKWQADLPQASKESRVQIVGDRRVGETIGAQDRPSSDHDSDVRRSSSDSGEEETHSDSIVASHEEKSDKCSSESSVSLRVPAAYEDRSHHHSRLGDSRRQQVGAALVPQDDAACSKVRDAETTTHNTTAVVSPLLGDIYAMEAERQSAIQRVMTTLEMAKERQQFCAAVFRHGHSVDRQAEALGMRSPTGAVPQNLQVGSTSTSFRYHTCPGCTAVPSPCPKCGPVRAVLEESPPQGSLQSIVPPPQADQACVVADHLTFHASPGQHQHQHQHQHQRSRSFPGHNPAPSSAGLSSSRDSNSVSSPVFRQLTSPNRGQVAGRISSGRISWNLTRGGPMAMPAELVPKSRRHRLLSKTAKSID